MEHFHIIQALCRTALSQKSDSVRQQVLRLKEALEKNGSSIEAKAISNLLSASERAVEMAPSRLGRSAAIFKGEEITRSTPVPTNKETSIPIVEIKFIDELPDRAPLFNKAVTNAIEAILDEWKNLEKIAAVDIEPIRSCLIYGIPGTGKTQLALWMAKKLGLPVVIARLDGLVSSFLGTTSRNIGNLFEFADRYKCLLLLDEFDAIAKYRADPHEVGEIKRVVNTLLQSLDSRKNQGFTIGITNHETLLDPAIWRRFDIQVEIPKPTLDVITSIIERHLPPVKLSEPQTKFLAWVLEGSTGADLETFTRWIKKSFAISSDFQHEFIGSIQQFLLLNSGRSNPEKRQIILGDRENLFRELKTKLNFSVTDLSELSGQAKSTISRAMKKIDEVSNVQ